MKTLFIFLALSTSAIAASSNFSPIDGYIVSWSKDEVELYSSEMGQYIKVPRDTFAPNFKLTEGNKVKIAVARAKIKIVPKISKT